MTNNRQTAREITAKVLEIKLDDPDLDDAWAGDVATIEAALDAKDSNLREVVEAYGELLENYVVAIEYEDGPTDFSDLEAKLLRFKGMVS